ncbi:PREDICTED: uncharacterized protein LOC106805582 [Priapulus caudatus]|uniref:Uncharacterized protein LOC106805582 n=1 Tax=Priapulus caudatus TaxID=37621 RepID=A0ABM1DS01_PRICU|nr:PREDICTED: uncharacterized protein LOC106805582 [Priapulus caudatus]
MKVVLGHDPSALPIAGLVVGDYTSLVIYYAQQYSNFDVSVRNCFAHDGTGHYKVDLVDDNGCSTDPEYVSQLYVESAQYSGEHRIYTTFRAFKFPDRHNVYFQCLVDVCYGKCYKRACTPYSATLRPRQGAHDDSHSFNVRVKRSATDGRVTNAAQSQQNTSSALTDEYMVEQAELFRALTILLPGEKLLHAVPLLGPHRDKDEPKMCLSGAGVVWGTFAMCVIIVIVAVVLCCGRAGVKLLNPFNHVC